MYEIKKTLKDKVTKWKIFFKFEKSEAEVLIEYDENEIDLYLVSLTDGFHWFEFFMAQEPNCDELEFKETSEYLFARKKVKELFEKNGFIFKPQDKESCTINGMTPYNDNQIEIIAKLIDERFANRERFF